MNSYNTTMLQQLNTTTKPACEEYILTLDLRIYDLATIYNACYGILDIAYISLDYSKDKNCPDGINSNILEITVTSKEPKYKAQILATQLQEQALCLLFMKHRKQKEYGTSNILLKRFVHWMEDYEKENDNTNR